MALAGGIAGLTLGSVGSLLIGGALLVGLSALTASLAKTKSTELATGGGGSGGYSSAPTPQDVQQTVRQAVPPRRRHYGRVKTGGYTSFFDSADGTFHQLILNAQGEIHAFEEHWLNDVQVFLGQSASVTETPFGSKVQYGGFDSGTGNGIAPATVTYGYLLSSPQAIEYVTIFPTTLIADAGGRWGFARQHGGVSTPYLGTVTATLYAKATSGSAPVQLGQTTFTNSLSPQFINSSDTATLFGYSVYITLTAGVTAGTGAAQGIDALDVVYASDLAGNEVVSTVSGGALGADPFTTTLGSALVTIYHAGHGFTTGNVLAFAGLVDAVAGIPISEFEADHNITVVDADNYRVTLTTVATAAGANGGSAVRWRKTNSGSANNYQFEGVNRVKIYSALGADDQAAHKVLVDAFPNSWGTYHRLAGIANTLISLQDVPQADFSAVYPQGIPQYRAVIAAAMVFDPRDEVQSADDSTTWEWSENPALAILDFLTHTDGMGRPRASFDIDSFTDGADVCDETVALKSGGVEARYRLAASYDLTEQPAAILNRLLASCDGYLYPTPEGKWGLRVGKWYAPTVTIESAAILDYVVEQGADALTKFNQLKITYTDPLNDYQETEAEPWEDADSISKYGTISDQLRLIECPSPSQARRLAKIAAAKGNPEWRGTIKTTLAGLVAYGEALARVKIDELEIDEDFLITSFEIAADLTHCIIGISSMASTAYDWDPDTEEGTRPAVALASIPLQVPTAPTNFAVVAGQVLIQGATYGAVGAASWDTPERDSLSHEIQYKRSSDPLDWVAVNVTAGVDAWQSGVLNDGVSYDFRLRAIGPGGAPSTWTATVTVVMTADTAAPNPPTALSSSRVGSAITVQWTNPTSANFYKTTIYRGVTAVFASASLIDTYHGGNGLTKSHVDSGLASGTYYYWVRALNASNVASSEVGPTSQVVP